MLALLVVALALQAPAPKAPPPPPAPSALPTPPPAPGDAGPLRGEWPAKPSGKRVTLIGALTVNEALDRIADVGGWNAVLDTGRTGARTFTLKLRDVPVEDALAATLAGTGLVATRTGGTVVVAEGAEVHRPAPVLSGFDQPSGKRFTGDFDAEPVGEALKQIASAAELSIVLPRGDLDDEVTASFKNVPVEDALRAVLTQGNLTARRDGALLVIERGELDLLGRLPPGLSREAKRAAEEGLERAREALRRAGRPERPEKEPSTRDRTATDRDLVIAAGDEVRDATAFSGNVTVQGGASARDVTAISGGVTLAGGAEAREVLALKGSAALEGGASARQVIAVLGDVTVHAGASVEQDVIAIGGKVRIDPGAEVGGSTQEISLPDVAKVIGGGLGHTVQRWTSPWLVVVEALTWFVVLFGLGLLATWLFPRRFEVISNLIAASPAPSVLAGLLGLLGAVLLSVLLAVTIIGALLVPVVVLALLAACLFGITGINLRIGQAIPLPPSRRTVVGQLALGTLVFVILAELPVVGWMVWITAILLAVGSTLRTRFGERPGGTTILPTTPVPPAAA